MFFNVMKNRTTGVSMQTIEALDAYVEEKLTNPADLAPLFATSMAGPVIEVPVDLAPGAGETMKMIFAEEVKEYLKRTRALASNVAAVYAVIWGQSSESVRSARCPCHRYY
jgi:hypothetical protein